MRGVSVARRHPKKTVGIGASLAWLIWLGVGLWTTFALNQLSVEQRFRRAEQRVSEGPRAEIFREVLEHERLVNELVRRGAVPPSLVRGDAGIVDPVVHEAVRPPTTLQKLHLKSDPTHDPEALTRRLRERNEELRRALAAAGGPLPDSARSFKTAEPIAPSPELRDARIARPAPVLRTRQGPADPVAEAVARLKALCVAQGSDLEEFPELCEHPELLETRVPPRPR